MYVCLQKCLNRCTMHGFCAHALCRLRSVFVAGVCAAGDRRGDHAVPSGAIPHVQTRRQGALVDLFLRLCLLLFFSLISFSSFSLWLWVVVVLGLRQFV